MARLLCKATLTRRLADNVNRERIIPSTLTGSINEAYYNGLNDVSGPTSPVSQT